MPRFTYCRSVRPDETYQGKQCSYRHQQGTTYVTMITEPQADQDTFRARNTEEGSSELVVFSQSVYVLPCITPSGTHMKLSTRVAGISRPIATTNDAIFEATMSTERHYPISIILQLNDDCQPQSTYKNRTARSVRQVRRLLVCRDTCREIDKTYDQQESYYGASDVSRRQRGYSTVRPECL